MSFHTATIRTSTRSRSQGNSEPILQRKCACGQHTGGGECAACRQQVSRFDASRTACRGASWLHSHAHGNPAPAGSFATARPHSAAEESTGLDLASSQPGDPMEHEAERVAAQIMRMPVSPGWASGIASRTKPFRPATGPSGGWPLPSSVNTYMAPRFGLDFDHVRVHTDAAAERMSRAVDARAFTIGADIYFGEGQYQPDTDRGRHLLAHELTHVMQQVGSGPILQRRPRDPSTSPSSPEGFGPGSSTLPYREATELLECIRIMGEENRDYCRQEVLGEEPEPPVALTSTPQQAEAVILPDGSQRLRVGNIDVLILPDLPNQAGVEGGHTSSHLELHPPQFNVPYELDTRRRITRFTPPRPRVTVTIQTQYGPSVDPSAASAYGRGTTQADIQAGTTSLQFHEGEHGRLYLEFLRTRRLPVFRGRRGMTEAQFAAAVRAYERGIRTFGQELNRYSLEHGDCVGTTIDQHHSREDPDWQPVCPAPRRGR